MSRSTNEALTPLRRKILTSPITWVALVYLTILLLLNDGFWINDNGVKFLQVRAIESSHFQSDSLPWPGEQLDPNFDFRPLRPPFSQVSDGRLYASYPPLFALLATVPHLLLGFPGLYVLPLLGTLATLAAVARLGIVLSSNRRSARRTANIAVLLTGFASPVWFYSFTFWEHTPALALSSWSLVACVYYRVEPSRRTAAWVGLLAGLAIYFRTDAYLLAAILGVTCAVGGRRPLDAATLGLVLIATLLPLWIFQWSTYGNPLGLHLQSQEWGQLDLSSFLKQRQVVASNIFLNTHRNSLLSVAIALPFLLLAPVAWKLRAQVQLSDDRSNSTSDYLAAAALVSVLVGGAAALHGHLSTSRPLHWLVGANGLFSVSPILILAFLPGEMSRYQERVRAGRTTLLSVLFLNVCIYAALMPERNTFGIHWGCRFLLIAYPILAVLSAARLVEIWERAIPMRLLIRVLTVAVLVLAVASQLYSLELLRARKEFTARLVTDVSQTPGDLIVTTVGYLPADLARIFYERPIFLVRSRSDVTTIMNRARTRGSRAAVYIVPHRSGFALPPGVKVISDGWLGFSTLAIQERSLDPIREGSGNSNTRDP
jgi:hypothetical protein